MRGDKYIIGLTGNIATGKSTVARMLERLGAKVIDADRLVHWLLDKDKALKNSIVREFGSDILDENGRIVRKRLAAKVFGKPDALRRLEGLVHPRVIELTKWLINRADEKVIVVEAIKLIEAGMHADCDALWVVTCSRDEQLRRLVENRKMSPQEALIRIRAQPPQELKIALADVVIHNESDLGATWEQVKKEWEKVCQALKAKKVPEAPEPEKYPERAEAEIVARKAVRQDLAALAQVMSEASGKEIPEDEALMRLLEKGYILALSGDRPVGALGWLAENLVASIEDVFISPDFPAAKVLPAMLDAMEEEACTLLCEVAMVALRPDDPSGEIYERSGYQRQDDLDNLYKAWREAAAQLLKDGGQLYLKRLREEIITKPI